MIRIFSLSLLAFLPCFAFASAVDSARQKLDESQKNYAQTLAEISAQKNAYNEEIKKLTLEIKHLDSELKFMRSSILDTDELSEISAKKAENFEMLRARTQSDLGEFSVQGSAFAYGQESFLTDFVSALNSAKAEIFSEKIYEKLFEKSDFETAYTDFKNGSPVQLLADPTLGKLRNSRKSGIVAQIEAGGIWMYPILLFGIVAFGISIAKSIVIFGQSRLPKTLANKAEFLAKAGETEALKVANKAPKPYKSMLVSFVKNRNLASSFLEEVAYEQMLSVGDKLYSGLGLLSVTASVAPLLGLLGTVTGIIKTFTDLSIYGAGNPELMSGGISEALITTEYGLIVAIPAFVVHAVLTRRAKAILADMEKIASAFLSKNTN